MSSASLPQDWDLSQYCSGRAEDGHAPLVLIQDCPAREAHSREHQDEIDEAWRNKQIAEELYVELRRREVKRLANAQEAMVTFRVPEVYSLTHALAMPDDEEPFSIDGLLPLGGNVLFSARHKTGKTTLITQLARAYADGVPFLGRFAVNFPDDSNVGLFNFEMSPAQYHRWMRRVRIDNPDRIILFHLRGISLPLGVPAVRDQIVEWLIANRIGVWIIDTAARAMCDGDPNKNEEVNPWLTHIAEIKARAGVRDVIILHHMAHSTGGTGAEQRGMGATAWSAWPDALWNLTKNDEGQRFFSANGRDVDVPQQLIEWDDETGLNQYGGGSPDEVSIASVMEPVLAAVRDEPGISKSKVRERVTVRASMVDQALQALIANGAIVMTVGANNRHSYYAAGAEPVPQQQLPDGPDAPTDNTEDSDDD